MSTLRIKKTSDCVEKSWPKEETSPVVMTIGHSTRTLGEFIGQLQAHGATRVVDVRTVPWRCHRSLIADALLVRGIRTEDIMSATRRQVHTLTPFAKVLGTAITYPTEASGSIQKKSSAKRSRPQPVAKTTPKQG